MAKPAPPPPNTELAYGMRQVGNGKWEAFRVRVPVSAIEPLSPIHKVALTEMRWANGKVPDTSVPDHMLLTKPAKVLGEVKTGKWVEHRGERLELALARMQETQRHEQVLKLGKRKTA